MSIAAFEYGLVAVAARGFWSQGSARMTVIVKTTLRIDAAHGDLARLVVAAPKPLVREDVHLRGNPVASLIHASDLALALPRCEVLVVGRAWAPKGAPTRRMSVSLSLHRAGKPLLEKSIDVTGDRRGTLAAQDEPDAFESVPLVYERSVGGMLSRENPVGMGMEAGSDGRFDVPNLAFAKQSPFAPRPGEAAAGFGPVPSVWPIRAQRRGSLNRSQATSGDWLTLPRDFDTRYFQCAPNDQQLDALSPGDVVTLTGMAADHPRLSFELPELRPSAVVESPSGERTPVDLRMDTLHVEPDHLTVEVVFRGTIALRAQETSGWRVGGALTDVARPFVFPSFDAPMTTRLAEPTREEAALGTTLVLEPEEDKSPVGIRAPSPSAPHASLPDAPRPIAPDEDPGERMPTRLETTMVLELDADLDAPRERHSTMLIEEASAPQSLPFDRRDRKPAEVAPRSAPPGAPWAKGKPAEAPEPAGLHSTLVIAPPESERPPPPEPPHAPTPREDADPAPAKPKKASPWREDPEELAPQPPPKPAPPPRADLKSQLYRKLKK